MKIAICCPIWWNARNGCDAWPSYEEAEGLLHGCGREPDHEGPHKCPCGAKKKNAD